MSNRRDRPKVGKLHINSRLHRCVVLKVVSYDAKGRPSQCVIGYGDTKFDVVEGMEFWTAYAPVQMAESKPEKALQ